MKANESNAMQVAARFAREFFGVQGIVKNLTCWQRDADAGKYVALIGVNEPVPSARHVMFTVQEAVA